MKRLTTLSRGLADTITLAVEINKFKNDLKVEARLLSSIQGSNFVSFHEPKGDSLRAEDSFPF